MNLENIVQFSRSNVLPEEYYLAPEKLITGNPKQTVWKHYVDASGQFFAGIWQSEPGKWHVSYTEEEYCQIIFGRSLITDTTGKTMAVSDGASFVIPRGFIGTWEVVEETRKTYVIYEAV